MIKRLLVVLLSVFLAVTLAVAIAAQGRGGGGPGGAPALGGRTSAPAQPLPSPNVTADRLLKAAQEPQDWLMYSGAYNSQRHSPLTQITTANAKDLTLKWVFQSRSLEKSEVTPLVVNGTMYTVQSPNDVIALNAVTGKTLWSYTYIYYIFQ